MLRLMPTVGFCFVLVAAAAHPSTSAKADTRQIYGIIVFIVDSQDRPLAGIPVNVDPIYSSGRLSYTPAVYVTPNFTAQRGVTAFNLAPGQYQIRVGGNSSYYGTIRALQVRNSNQSVKIVLAENRPVVEPPGVFTPVDVTPPRPVDLNVTVLQARIVNPGDAGGATGITNDRGIAGVTVRLQSIDGVAIDKSTVSDDNGKAPVKVPVGRYRVTVSKAESFANVVVLDLPRGHTLLAL